ncbi:hypothetical protein KJ855_03050 [Patescibacteria group bacterium]|nr:hypothetical protein [Patescibacteria group bacterium]
MKIGRYLQLFFVGLMALIVVGTNIFPARAQVATRQRTTGTYLPVLAQVKKESLIDVLKGGTVFLDDGGLDVEVPAGIYENNLRISVRRVKWEDNSAVGALNVGGEGFVGADVFEIAAVDEETGRPVLEFDKKIICTFRYFDEETAGLDESSLRIRFFNRVEQKWEEVESNLDINSNSITAEIDHLTLFAMTGNLLDYQAEKKGDGESSGFWSGALKVLLVLGLILLSGFGGYYVYTAYMNAKSEMEMQGDVSIAGGSQDQGMPIPEKQTPLSPDIKPAQDAGPKKDDKDKKSPTDSNNEIWIDF